MMEDFKKKCPRCDLEKLCSGDRERSRFHRSLTNSTGFQSICKVCQAQTGKEQRAANKKKHLEALRGAQLAAYPPETPEFEITVQEPAQGPSAPPPAANDTPKAVIVAQEDTPKAVMQPPKVDEAAVKVQLQIARLKQEKAHLSEQVKHLEKMALSGEAIRELIGSLGLPNVIADPDWLRGPRQKRSVTGTAVLCLSDIHGDEVVRREQVGGANEYNREICLRRLRNTFKSGVVLLKDFMAAPKYEGAIVPLIGDLVSGNIHEELVETNEAPIQQTMLVMEEALIEGLGIMADEFGKVHVPCVTGNHGRMHRKPRAKNRAWENFEWAIYQRIAAYFKTDSRLTFDIPEGSDAFFTAYSTRFNVTHGDQFRGGDGVGGILVPIRRGLSRKQFKQTAMGEPFDVMLIGHWHQLIMLNDLIVNGSVKGLDEYAYQGNFAFEPPQQALFVIHPEVGMSARWPILCGYEGGRVLGKALKDP